MKKSIITIVAFMLFALAGFAQENEKYDIIILLSDGAGLTMCTKEKAEVVKLSKGELYPIVKLLSKVDELQNEGWEIESSLPTNAGWSFTMKKKKQ